MEYRLVHDVQRDDCHFQTDPTFHHNQQSNTSCNRCEKKLLSFVFFFGFAAGVFVTFVICFAMEMLIPHKAPQCPDVTCIVQKHFDIDKQMAQFTTETLTSTDTQVATTEISEVFSMTETLTITDTEEATTEISEVFSTTEPHLGKYVYYVLHIFDVILELYGYPRFIGVISL
jgi:hypothetical protein